MKIICDTNIWYAFSSGKLDFNKYKHLNLVPTYTNLNELVITENVIHKFDLVKNALTYLLFFKDKICLIHPFLQIAEVNGFTHQIRNDGAVELLRQAEIIASSASINGLGPNYTIANIKRERKYREDVPEFFKDELSRSGKSELRNHDQIEKLTYMMSVLVNQFIRNTGVIKIIDSKKNELLLKTFSRFFNEMQIQMKMTGNDWYDLYILSYVQPGDKYWTLEKRWLNLITSAGMAEYLFK